MGFFKSHYILDSIVAVSLFSFAAPIADDSDRIKEFKPIEDKNGNIGKTITLSNYKTTKNEQTKSAHV